MIEWLKTELSGRKARLMWATIIVAVAARWGWDVDVEMVLGLVGLVAVRILGIAAEDAGAKVGLPPPSNGNTNHQP